MDWLGVMECSGMGMFKEEMMMKCCKEHEILKWQEKEGMGDQI